jgi:hypothetical protein
MRPKYRFLVPVSMRQSEDIGPKPLSDQYRRKRTEKKEEEIILVVCLVISSHV